MSYCESGRRISPNISALFRSQRLGQSVRDVLQFPRVVSGSKLSCDCPGWTVYPKKHECCQNVTVALQVSLGRVSRGCVKCCVTSRLRSITGRPQANRKRRSSSVSRPSASESRPTVPSNTSRFFSCTATCANYHRAASELLIMLWSPAPCQGIPGVRSSIRLGKHGARACGRAPAA